LGRTSARKGQAASISIGVMVEVPHQLRVLIFVSIIIIIILQLCFYSVEEETATRETLFVFHRPPLKI
jgi:hypothetical protein